VKPPEPVLALHKEQKEKEEERNSGGETPESARPAPRSPRPDRRERRERNFRPKEPQRLETVAVPLTPMEQEVYALMGVSPLVSLGEERDPRSLVVKVCAPGEEAAIMAEANQNLPPLPPEPVPSAEMSLDSHEGLLPGEGETVALTPAITPPVPSREPRESRDNSHHGGRTRTRRRHSSGIPSIEPVFIEPATPVSLATSEETPIAPALVSSAEVFVPTPTVPVVPAPVETVSEPVQDDTHARRRRRRRGGSGDNAED
jgi:hypothetical protein